MICCVTITNVVSFLVDSCQAQSVKGIDDVSVVVASVVNVNKRNKRIIIVTIIVIVVDEVWIWDCYFDDGRRWQPNLMRRFSRHSVWVLHTMYR